MDRVADPTLGKARLVRGPERVVKDDDPIGSALLLYQFFSFRVIDALHFIFVVEIPNRGLVRQMCKAVRRQGEVLIADSAVLDAHATGLIGWSVRLVFLFRPVDVADRRDTVIDNVVHIGFDGIDA